jgi:hypothetical protein
MTLLDLNAKVERIFKNPNINFFIIMNLVLMISCFSIINDNTKLVISKFFSNPIITILSLVLIIIVGYFNINISIMGLALLFIFIYTYKTTDSNIEGFENGNENQPIIANSFEDRKKILKGKRSEMSSKLDKEKRLAKTAYQTNRLSGIERKINSFKDIITNNLHSVSKEADNEFKQGLLDNKLKILENEKNNRKSQSNNDKSKDSNRKKETFQTIEKRKFNPSSEEDTNFLITKEILKDMINRIEYNYETTPYLKKYIKHRIEEVIDTNNLLKEDED